jgi:glutathione synthase/RimK-type ligase-like ATP-grasp enzyme
VNALKARTIGDGFHGVDVKETPSGFIVMEVNDNPNLEHGIRSRVYPRSALFDCACRL